jgi:DNA-directed RNA polymerase subunit H (RpoH/RPB5)
MTTAPKSLSSYLYESRTIILEMLEERGFDTSKYKNFTKLEMSNLANDIKTKTPEPIIVSTPLAHTEVHYLLDKNNPTPKTISILLQVITENQKKEMAKKEQTIVVVLKTNASPSVQKSVQSIYKETGIYVQIFSIRTLMFNIIKHEYVPKHIRLPIFEFEKIKDKFQIKSPEQLPHILQDDPVAKFIGLRPNELCKIIRPSLNAGIHEVYRYCV